MRNRIEIVTLSATLSDGVWYVSRVVDKKSGMALYMSAAYRTKEDAREDAMKWAIDMGFLKDPHIPPRE